jgi:hypothetical protein
MRTKDGREPRFDTPETLLEEALGYFDWLEANPLWEHKITQYQGEPVEMKVPKMRVATLNGLYLYLCITRTTWDRYREKPDFSAVIEQIESLIYENKFSGAAADLVNANIIARDLGLVDKREETSDVHVHISDKDSRL